MFPGLSCVEDQGMPTTSPIAVLPSAVFVPAPLSGAALPAPVPATAALFRTAARTAVLVGLGIAFVVVLARLG
jgi:hypothetical protein